MAESTKASSGMCVGVHPFKSGLYSCKNRTVKTVIPSFIKKTIPLIATLKKGCTNPCMCGLFYAEKWKKVEKALGRGCVLVKSPIKLP